MYLHTSKKYAFLSFPKSEKLMSVVIREKISEMDHQELMAGFHQEFIQKILPTSISPAVPSEISQGATSEIPPEIHSDQDLMPGFHQKSFRDSSRCSFLDFSRKSTKNPPGNHCRRNYRGWRSCQAPPRI